jgi:CBS domain-containing protein
MQARDVMTTVVVCVDSKSSVFDAAELMISAGVSAVPVIDDKGGVIGIVSEADLMRRPEIGTAPRKSWLSYLFDSSAASARQFVEANSRRVSEVMTSKVVTADEETRLGDLAELMESRGVKRIPIMRKGELVGIVSRADLMRALLSREASGPEVQPTDKALRQAVIAALDRRHWRSRWPTNVFANDGVVHLWGFVEDETVRKAYRVAAENVPGVRRVKNHLRPMPASVGMGI